MRPINVNKNRSSRNSGRRRSGRGRRPAQSRPAGHSGYRRSRVFRSSDTCPALKVPQKFDTFEKMDKHVKNTFNDWIAIGQKHDSQAHVYEVSERSSGNKYIIKALSFLPLPGETHANFYKSACVEATFHNIMASEDIGLPLSGFYYAANPPTAYLIMRKADGTLHELITNSTNSEFLDTRTLEFIQTEVRRLLKAQVKLGVLCADQKPSNILYIGDHYTNPRKLLLADFGSDYCCSFVCDHLCTNTTRQLFKEFTVEEQEIMPQILSEFLCFMIAIGYLKVSTTYSYPLFIEEGCKLLRYAERSEEDLHVKVANKLYETHLKERLKFFADRMGMEKTDSWKDIVLNFFRKVGIQRKTCDQFDSGSGESS